MYAPCKDCKKRIMNCHSKCEEYLKYSEEQNKLRAARASIHNEIGIMQDSVKRGKRR